ncbi:MAG TPA: 4-(cytidine 5'-diphospho)-2-C-methyl-D-erythritol kinase [Hyphomicrobiaceae bacterium]|jgi:4-diphosphocytidyl-2-C-methyl-D-erythritol kinase|nr:4-(cytidine 5'-diphospho)-2-C-methyl-D-erythritol kinase [Hyphomicrobiaceae bacterium]
MGVWQLARAKVNLTLKVLGRRSDGYHELESLVTFAAVADRLSLVPGEPTHLVASGPYADAIEAPNILERALDLLRQQGVDLRGAIALEKNLPVAAGLGGGSADAAALLRLARALHAERLEEPLWREVARRLGADVSVCLADRPALIRGIGDEVDPLPPGAEPLPAVLANPGVRLATPRVFAALDAPPVDRTSARDLPPAPLRCRQALFDHMGAVGNDLERPAAALEPVIATLKAALLARPGCRAAAMSGSGPTCFGIFASEDDAAAAALALRSRWPRWWIVATNLDDVVSLNP